MDTKENIGGGPRWQQFFSIIADESRDCSNKEQIPLIICFVNKKFNNKIQEMFLAFVECEHGTSGEAIASLLNRCVSLWD